MYERFTDRARRVVRTAYGPRSRRRAEVTEAEVVAALGACGGVAGALLSGLGAGAGSPAGLAPLVGCRALAQSANAEARRLGCSYVGTEHLLLALAQTAGSGLPAAGATAEVVEARLAEINARPVSPELAALQKACEDLLKRVRRELRRNPFLRRPPPEDSP